MTGAKNNSIVEKIKEVSDIVDIVGESVVLRRAGRYYCGLCPFHAEKTPSFYVDPQRQIFHCFGCGAGGDVIKFVMQLRGLSFTEALEFLAERYNISIDTSQSRKTTSGKQQLLQYTVIAEEFYYRQLRYSSEGSVAREYLKKRLITDRIVEEQRLGYAPKSWDALARHFREKGLDLHKGLELGLFGVTTNRSQDKFYDRFRNRLIFPIRNSSGQVVAFGGRTLEDGPSTNEPKYLNSPESELYQKRKILYQFHLAQEACRKEKRQLVLVEGYMDALAFHRVGFYRIVATLGTALTPQQARLIKRIADEVILVYDGDEAGIKAMVRNFPVLAQEGIKSSCIILPDGMDPDDFFRSHSMQDFEVLMEARKDLGEFVVEEIVKTWDGSTSGKLKVLMELFPYIEAVGQPVIQAEYLKLSGILLGLGEEVVFKQFKSWQSSSHRREGEVASVSVPKKVSENSRKGKLSERFFSIDKTSSLEEEILKILIAYPHFVETACKLKTWQILIENFLKEKKTQVDGSELVYLIFLAIHEEWLEFSKNRWNKNQFCIDRVYERIRDSRANSLFSRMVFECKAYNDETTAFMLLNDYLGALEKKIVRLHRERLTRELAEAEKKGDFENIRELLQKIQSLGSINNRKGLYEYEKAERGMVKDNEHDFQ